MAVKRDLCVEVRRESDGKIYSRILDRAVQSPADLTRVGERIRFVVMDRANRRGPLDHETVLHRAQYVAELLGVEYVEDLTWPCSASRGFGDCACPRCAEKADQRAKQ